MVSVKTGAASRSRSERTERWTSRTSKKKKTTVKNFIVFDFDAQMFTGNVDYYSNQYELSGNTEFQNVTPARSSGGVDLPLPTLRPRLHHFHFLDRGFLLRQREEGKVARK